MGERLNERRQFCHKKYNELQDSLRIALPLASGKACVYTTGSFARGEASQYSDLDLFIVGKDNNSAKPGASVDRALSRLDEICLKAKIIDATRAMNFPDFSGDGAYLVHYADTEIIKNTGQQNDDHANTFTARLLLLLESKPLLENEIYEKVIDDTLAAYWKDFDKHASDFVPAFLVNDILRLWRTFCVNYEARTQSEPDEKKAKRKLKNYKLKHSRLLTCYSAIAHMMARYQHTNTLSQSDAKATIRLTPTERIEQLTQDLLLSEQTREHASSIVAAYEKFLGTTNKPDGELVELFMDQARARQFTSEANSLGGSMHSLLMSMHSDSPMFRMLMV